MWGNNGPLEFVRSKKEFKLKFMIYSDKKNKGEKMAYFDGVKKGDRVWSFEFGWGEVISILYGGGTGGGDIFKVKFPQGDYWYDFYGKRGISSQTLFWDEIKFNIPEKPKIKLKENKYKIDLLANKVYTLEMPGAVVNAEEFYRDDRATAEIALINIKSYAKLLALRDQECKNSREYKFVYEKDNWYIAFNGVKFVAYKNNMHYSLFTIYFKTKEDAQKICDILNSGRFNLEGETDASKELRKLKEQK